MQMVSPAHTSKLTSCRTCFSPNDLLTCSNRIYGVDFGSSAMIPGALPDPNSRRLTPLTANPVAPLSTLPAYLHSGTSPTGTRVPPAPPLRSDARRHA